MGNWIKNIFFYSEAEAFPNQIDFQDPATPIAEGIIDIHHHVFFFLVIVFFFWVGRVPDCAPQKERKKERKKQKKKT